MDTICHDYTNIKKGFGRGKIYCVGLVLCDV